MDRCSVRVDLALLVRATGLGLTVNRGTRYYVGGEGITRLAPLSLVCALDVRHLRETLISLKCNSKD